MAKHARLGPSGAESWMTCPDYPNAIVGLPDDDTEWSSEGTAAHTFHEECLRFGFDAWDLLGHKLTVDGRTFIMTREWAHYLQPGIDRVREFGGKLYLEHRVKLDRWLPKQFGTLDTGIILPDLIIIKDLKFGAGVPVLAERCKQLMLYGLGFWEYVAKHKTKTTKFKLIVDQPRVPGGGGEWDTTLDELLEFGKLAKKAGALTYGKNLPRVASEKGCRFCPAAKNAKCDEYDRFNLELMDLTFQDLDAEFEEDPTMPKRLTAKRRSFVLLHRAMFNRWLDSLSQDELTDGLQGRPTPGRKPVQGRGGARKWRDEEEVEDFLVEELGRKQAFNQSLKSPPQVEKELDRTAMAALLKRMKKKLKHDPVVQEPGKIVMVAESDAKPAYRPVNDAFRDLENE